MDIIYRYCVCLMFNLFLVIFLVTILRSRMAVRFFFPEIEVNRWNLVVVIATHQRISAKITSLCFMATFFLQALISDSILTCQKSSRNLEVGSCVNHRCYRRIFSIH